ncbi:MAG TPA: cytochrome c [Euryarchaeota archaeon]|nr:cytochrome c [archaeon BMS3Abin16]GBE56698.1 cytochrome c [archaeon BMS3Bbin16]HDH28418.1 cytochrome c [Euryarchaeota archaeon]
MDLKTALTTGLLIILVSMVLSAGCLTGSSPESREPPVVQPEYFNLVNPSVSNAVSIEKGKSFYSKNCKNCHGSEGFGDGAQAIMYEPKPTNLHDSQVQDKSEGELFQLISEGVKGTSMPAFKWLSEDDRWDIVNFMRTFEVEEGA